MKKKNTARMTRRKRRDKAYRAALARGRSQKQAQRSALRKVPLKSGDTFKGVTKCGRKGKFVAGKTGRSASMTANKRKRRSYKRNGKKNFLTAIFKPNLRQKGSRSINSRFRKNGFQAQLKELLKTGAFAATGFFTHRLLTNIVADRFVLGGELERWKKPLVGAAILAVGIPLSSRVASNNGVAIGAGMVVSWLQGLLLSVFSGQPQVVQFLGNYGSSRAYQLQGGRRRRGLRGGLERHATSIMPRYTPTGEYFTGTAGLGQYEQAAAGVGEYFTGTAGLGQFEQAAAGVGEYFTGTAGLGQFEQAAAGVGEYFAPKGLQGVGAYEAAGQLAMQATAGSIGPVEDGLRPDANLDLALDEAEANAGLRGAVHIGRVGRQSQWIPNGPMWAGEEGVGTQATSEMSAGILARSGGNGILSN